jgi:hypothetical protein
LRVSNKQKTLSIIKKMNILNLFHEIIKFIGIGNIISLITFLVSLFICYHFYFKSFYRLVYSTGRICKNCTKISDWSNPENIFNTRILIYNNGRKTISKEQISKLEIIPSDKIYNIKIIKSVEGLSTNVEKKIKLNFENLDSKDFIVLEFEHNGTINLEGRVIETGKILDTEPKNWVIVNGFFVMFITIMLFYNVYINLGTDTPNVWICVLNFIILYGIYYIIRFIHKLLFIPDSLHGKYLEVKDKTNSEFNS